MRRTLLQLVGHSLRATQCMLSTLATGQHATTLNSAMSLGSKVVFLKHADPTEKRVVSTVGKQYLEMRVKFDLGCRLCSQCPWLMAAGEGSATMAQGNAW